MGDWPARIRPTIEWQVAGACNYDCTYCIQSRKYRKGRPQRAQLERALDVFAALPGTWELKCSGGEAFAHPLFMELVVPGLMARTPHHISVLTNLSATHHELQRFAHLTRDRLRVFSASLHLEFVELHDFVAKVVWLRDQLDPDVDLVVNQVVVPGKLDDCRRARDLLAEHDVRWFPQLFKTKGGVFAYDDDLTDLIGTNPSSRDANVAPNYQGRRCWAGVAYFVVDKDGSAWSCRTAKRHGQGSLGNLFTGEVERLVEALPCPYTICPCSVPANRGLIEGVA